jgi:phospholipase A1/A2
LTAGAAAAAPFDWALASAQTHVLVGDRVTVTVLRSGSDDAEPMPDTLLFRVSGAGRTVELRFTARPDGDGQPHPQESHRRAYEATLPAELEGLITLELADRPSSKLLLAAQKVLQEKPAAIDTLARMRGKTEVQEALAPAKAPALTSHEPVYFLVGNRGNNTARFQLSFKYRLFDDEGVAVHALPLLSGLHFAYTQTSLWDLQSNSKPFRDTSYRPSFFYQWQGATQVAQLPAWRVQTGFEHESNGRDGDKSRSINTLFVEPEWRLALPERWYVAIAPKVYGYLDKHDNPDIGTYRGYANLRLALGRDDGWLWSSTLRRGARGFGSVQLDASYPLRRPIFADTGGYFYFQYFNGYGETLLDYNVRHKPQFRLGFAIVR